MFTSAHKTKYKILHDFQVKHLHVLQLDSDYEYGDYTKYKAVIEDNYYKYMLNSIESWVVLYDAGSFPEDYFKGKTVEFIKDTDEMNERIAV